MICTIPDTGYYIYYVDEIGMIPASVWVCLTNNACVSLASHFDICAGQHIFKGNSVLEHVAGGLK